MHSPRISFCKRLSLLTLFLVALSLSACGNNNSTFQSKRDTGSNVEDEDTGVIGDDTGNNSDTGNNGSGDNDTGNNGETDTGENPDDPCLETTAEQAADFATNYARALCQKMWSCDSNATIAMFASLGGWTDEESCVNSVLAANMTAAQARAAVNNGSMKLNSCAATACLEEIEELNCYDAETPMRENYVPFIDSCYQALAGNLSTGQPCTINGQCGTGEFCQPDDEQDVCGGSCADVGLYGSGQCGDIICRGDQYCVPDNDVCVSRHADGESCEEDYHCKYNSECVDGQCAPIVSGLGEGSTCDLSTALCEFGLICVGGTCQKPASTGETCAFFGCSPDLYCNSEGKCVAKGGADASCTDGSQCLSTHCVAGKCTDLDALCP